MQGRETQARQGRGVLVNGRGPSRTMPRWAAASSSGSLSLDTADEIKKETRGVAIAVLERKNQFAFDTITWCDEIELVDRESAAGQAER